MGDGRYAIALEDVLEVAPRVLIAPLPGVPLPIAGLLRHRGSIAVVVDLRSRFGAPAGTSMDDHFIVVTTPRRRVALIVDRATAVRELDASRIVATPMRSPHVRGTIDVGDGLILLHDLELVLSLEEESAIERALSAVPA